MDIVVCVGMAVCVYLYVSMCERMGVDEVGSITMVGCMCEREVKRWVCMCVGDGL